MRSFLTLRRVANGPYGVSIHKVNTKVDSGDILFRKKIKDIDFIHDAKKLYDINKNEITSLFKKKYKILRKNKATRGISNENIGKINRRKNMIEKCVIDLDKNYKAEYLINLLRAKNFIPNKGVIFTKNKKRYSINIDIKLIKSKKI